MKDGDRSVLGAARCILLVAVLGGLGACGGGGGGGGNDNSPPPEPPATSINRLNVTIADAEVDEGRHPVVRFTLTDENGGPLSATGVRIRLVVAVLDPDTHEYRDYITTVQTSPDTDVAATQSAAEDSAAGTLQDLGAGFFRYRFAIALPEGYDGHASHRIAIYADVTLDDVGWVSNAVHDFVPSGGPLPAERDIVRTEACNGCHDPLEAHGGTRRDVRLCVTCHSTRVTDATTGEVSTQIDPDTGNRLGFPELIHKIHRGESLPSVEAGTPYQIVGFRQSVADFSHVVFPQDVRNCETCHAGGTQSHFFSTKPSRAACGSCHDDVNFASGANHGGGPQPNDGSCSACHVPDSGREFDQSVVGAHVIPAHSSQARGVHFELIAVQSAETGFTTVRPGEHPVVTFRITDDDGVAIPAVTMSSLSFTLGGPTVEYSAQDYDGDGTIVPGDPSSPWTPGAETFKSESAIKDASGTDASGVSRYAFKSSVPPNATGTYVVGVEGYKCATIDGANQRLGGTNCSGNRDPNGDGSENPGEVFDEVRDVGHNEVLAFAVTDPVPIPRRQPVTIARCSACHGEFSKDFLVHGGIRNDVTYCPVCHNPSNDTLSRQLPPVGATATTSPVDFKVMIHAIHRGENRTVPYVLYGRLSGPFPNQTENPVDFSDVLFPGDLRDCEACHAPGSYVLSPGQGVLQAGVLPSTTRQFMRSEREKTVLQVFSTPPTISVCTSCHDDVDFTTGENHPAGPQPESSCAGCHGVGKRFSVESEHFPGLARADRILRPN